jgi:CRISPR-associated protein Cmr3
VSKLKIAIEALDLLFFRNAKPFDSANSAFGETLEMPYTSTIYGALRSKILSEHYTKYNEFKRAEGGLLTDVIGSPDKKGSLKINFFSILNDKDELFLPIANDLVVDKDNPDSIFPLDLNKKPKWLNCDSNYQFDYLLTTSKNIKVEKPERKYISLKSLEKYLNNESDLDIEKDNFEFFTKEYRTGIKINKDLNTVEEGKLYRKELIRLKDDYNYYLELSNDEELLPKKGLLKLGGGGKGVSYYSHYIDNSINLSKETKMRIEDTGKFKIYLSTPAILNKGWIPEFIDDNLIATLESGIKIKIICSSIGKFKMISGWDLAKGRPKTAYRVLPAGSVYYCEILNDDFKINNLLDELHGQSLSDKRRKDGFGISYIGGIKNV